MINHRLAKLRRRPGENKQVMPLAGFDLGKGAVANLLCWNNVNRNSCVISLAPAKGQVFHEPFIKLRKKVGPFCDPEGFLSGECVLRKEKERAAGHGASRQSEKLTSRGRAGCRSAHC